MLRTGTKSIRTWIKNTGIGIDLDPDTTVLFDLDPDPSFDWDPNLTYSTLGDILSHISMFPTTNFLPGTVPVPYRCQHLTAGTCY